VNVIIPYTIAYIFFSIVIKKKLLAGDIFISKLEVKVDRLVSIFIMRNFKM
jgi:hypothetical protein